MAILELGLEAPLSSGGMWSLKEINGARVYTVITADGRELKEFLSKRQLKHFDKDEEAARAFLATYAELLARPLEAKVCMENLGPCANFTQEQLSAAATAESSLVGFLYLAHASRRPREASSTCLRLAHISAISGVRDLSHSLLMPLTDLVRGLDLDVHLDFLDYVLNGEGNSTYGEFLELNKGRAFPTQLRAGQTWGQDGDLTYQAVNRVTYRFLQLTRRSQKLKKQLYSLSREDLIKALSAKLPGTLLVPDTMELIETLKDIPPSTVPELGYRRHSLRVDFGETVYGELLKLDCVQEVQDIMNKTVITDGYSPTVFYAHAFKKFGVKEGVELLGVLANQTEGITSRGFMELVRRGGFADGEQPSWIVNVLA